jgi:uncharacterized membrane protein HdeD (DUF308 family)
MATSSGVLSGIGADARALCKRAWWVFLIGGIASTCFGVLAFVNPGVALFVLATLFAAYLLVDGISNVIGSVQNRQKDGWWIMLLIGILGVVVGGYALLNPPLSMLAFIYLVALEAIVLGVFLVMLGYKVRQTTTREWLLYAIGAVSILFGAFVAMNPAVGSVTIIYAIATWAVSIGVLKVIFALKVKNLPERLESRLSDSGQAR